MQQIHVEESELTLKFIAKGNEYSWSLEDHHEMRLKKQINKQQLEDKCVYKFSIYFPICCRAH